MCINFRDMDGAVSKHFLDIADIDIGFKQAGCEGMTEHMRCDMQINSGEATVFVDHFADRLFR